MRKPPSESSSPGRPATTGSSGASGTSGDGQRPGHVSCSGLLRRGKTSASQCSSGSKLGIRFRQMPSDPQLLSSTRAQPRSGSPVSDEVRRAVARTPGHSVELALRVARVIRRRFPVLPPVDHPSLRDPHPRRRHVAGRHVVALAPVGQPKAQAQAVACNGVTVRVGVGIGADARVGAVESPNPSRAAVMPLAGTDTPD